MYPDQIHVAVDSLSLIFPFMTLRELAKRTEAALLAEFPNAYIIVEESDIPGDGFVRCYNAKGDCCDFDTYQYVDHVIDEAWRSYAQGTDAV